jgi:glyoxylase-like metal-dependent hydrolase (beta-lactamase superfamily II)
LLSWASPRPYEAIRQRDAVLVDTLMTVDQNDVPVDWVRGSGKNLTTIYITHGHGDHWFRIGARGERFPAARAIRSPGVVKMMKEQSPEALKARWETRMPGQIPERLVIQRRCDLSGVHSGTPKRRQQV